MNTIKKNILRTFGLLALTALFAGAPEAHARGGFGGQGVLSQIELSEAQEQAIKEIRSASKEQKRAIFQNQEMSRDEKREALRELRQERKAAIDEVLTEEQRAALERLKAERQQAKLDRKMKRLTKKLDLSEAQADAIQLIFVETRTQMQAIKQGEGDREEKKAQIKALKTDAKAQILALLDDEQAEIFNKMRDRRNKRAKKARRGGKNRG